MHAYVHMHDIQVLFPRFSILGPFHFRGIASCTMIIHKKY